MELFFEHLNLSFATLFVTTFGRGLLSAVFLVSALSKLRQRRRFVSAVRAYEVLPPYLVRPFAYTLPWLELALGLLLFLGWKTRFAATVGGALLLCFTLAVGVNLARGRLDLECGCSGNHQKVSFKNIARNAALLLFSLPAALWGGGFLTLDSQSLAVREFLVETARLDAVLPLTISGVGLHFLSRLMRQLFNLIIVLPEHNDASVERHPGKHTPIRNLGSVVRKVS